jgi:hypothetical protein
MPICRWGSMFFPRLVSPSLTLSDRMLEFFVQIFPRLVSPSVSLFAWMLECFGTDFLQVDGSLQTPVSSCRFFSNRFLTCQWEYCTTVYFVQFASQLSIFQGNNSYPLYHACFLQSINLLPSFSGGLIYCHRIFPPLGVQRPLYWILFFLPPDIRFISQSRVPSSVQWWAHSLTLFYYCDCLFSYYLLLRLGCQL